MLLGSIFVALLSSLKQGAQSVTNDSIDITHIHLRDISDQSSDPKLHQTVSNMHSQIVMPKLEALLPTCMFHAYSADSPEAGLKVERASGAYLDLLSFSITNNFTGLDDLPAQRALDYLKSQSSTHIARLIQSIAGPTGRALAEKLFICAIEAQDASIVEIILRHSQNTKVDVNKAVCEYDGIRCTSIERSAGLHDIETTRVLLKYGADSNKTFLTDRSFMATPPGWREGALSCALDRDKGEMTPVEFELVQLLLEHGACVRTNHLDAALRQQKSDVVHALFQAGVWELRKEWEVHGHFGRAIEVLDDEAATGSINILKQIGADINAPSGNLYPTMLDVAAKRGNLDMVLMLLSLGAIETDKTLSYAIQGQNREVVDLFLKGEKADSLSIGIPPTTPYAEAIRVGDGMLMQILEQKGSWTNITESQRYVAALAAASEVGNVEVIQRLLETAPELSTNTWFQDALSDALRNAVEMNNETLAVMLIHAGANNENRFTSRSSSLERALENRNAQIARAILNLGTTPSYAFDASLVHAAKWGDISIIEDLMVSGRNIDWPSPDGTPLIIAIGKQDRHLLSFLLNAGSDPNALAIGGNHGRRSPLSTAIEIEDIDMVNYLLSVGADPGDPVALLKSCEKGGGALDLLSEAFLKRYPNGKRGYFDDALAQAVLNNHISTLENLRPIIALKFPGYSQHVSELIGTKLIVCNEASLRAVEMLLDSGANPNAVVWSEDQTERIPLICSAIKANSVRIVQLLLDKGADVNFPATRGIKLTPIQMAAKTGYYEILLTLINRGANVDAPAADAGGGTAIQMAAIGGFIGIVDLLLKKGAKINRSPSIVHGRTALEGAAEHGRLDMVQFLLQSGAQIDGGGRKSFLNAMKLAEENGHFVVMELLQSYSR